MPVIEVVKTKSMDEFNTNRVHTLLGFWEDNHNFISNNLSHEIWYNHMIKPIMGQHYWINIKYYDNLKVWGAFQMLEAPDDIECKK